MKTIKILFALLPLFLIFPSCSSDDDAPADNPVTVSQLLGKWKMDAASINGGAFIPIPDDEDIIYEFKTGGIITISYDFFDDDENDDDDIYTGTYTLSNNIVTIIIDGDTVPHTITQISNTSMRLAARFDWDENQGLDDVVFNFTKIPN
ncbi:MAG: lipocalin family protein [Gillisia sp.]